VLGRDIYVNNKQMGGPKVMGCNGVSQLVVRDDLSGVGCILKWLSYIPAKKGTANHRPSIGIYCTIRPIKAFPCKERYGQSQTLNRNILHHPANQGVSLQRKVRALAYDNLRF
jgi:hypothetical protein